MRRRWSSPWSTRLLVVAACTLLAACGGATKFPEEAGSDALRSTGTVATVPRPTTTLPPATVPAETTTTATPSTTRRTTSPPTRPTTTRAPAPTVNAADQTITRAALGPPGGAAGVILQPTPARTLVVEVMAEAGAPAAPAAVSRVLSDLRRFSGKQVSEVRTALPGGSSSKRWTERELAAVADRSSQVAQGGGRFVLRLLFVRGENARSPNILAVSFRGDTFAAFPDRYASASPQVVTAVTVHEFGHLLGLVDLYLDRGRADTVNDPAGGGHSSNPQSVMYFAVDPSFLGALFGSASDRFDAADERDLAAIRAGAAPNSDPR